MLIWWSLDLRSYYVDMANGHHIHADQINSWLVCPISFFAIENFSIIILAIAIALRKMHSLTKKSNHDLTMNTTYHDKKWTILAWNSRGQRERHRWGHTWLEKSSIWQRCLRSSADTTCQWPWHWWLIQWHRPPKLSLHPGKNQDLDFLFQSTLQLWKAIWYHYSSKIKDLVVTIRTFSRRDLSVRGWYVFVTKTSFPCRTILYIASYVECRYVFKCFFYAWKVFVLIREIGKSQKFVLPW